MKYKVIETYQIAYPNPIKLKAGDTVIIEKQETNPDWLGWAFCVDQSNNKGWVSEKILQIKNLDALVINDYDATELAVNKDDFVIVKKIESGWAWSQNTSGLEGWVPLKNLSFA